MSPGRSLGIAVVVIGLALVIFGVNASQSLLDQAPETVTGRYTDQTLWSLIGGMAAIVGGGLFVFFARKP